MLSVTHNLYSVQSCFQTDVLPQQTTLLRWFPERRKCGSTKVNVKTSTVSLRKSFYYSQVLLRLEIFDTKLKVGCFFPPKPRSFFTTNAGDLGFKLGNFGDFDRVQCEDFWYTNSKSPFSSILGQQMKPSNRLQSFWRCNDFHFAKKACWVEQNLGNIATADREDDGKRREFRCIRGAESVTFSNDLLLLLLLLVVVVVVVGWLGNGLINEVL